MRRMIGAVVAGILLLAGVQAEAQSGKGKFGYRAAEFVAMNPDWRVAYAIGVADALDVAGMRCPNGVRTGVNLILARTDAKIYEHWERREQLWAGAVMIAVFADLGCRLVRE